MSWIPMTMKQSDYEFIAEIEARKNHVAVLESLTKFEDETRYDEDNAWLIPRITHVDNKKTIRAIDVKPILEKPITTMIEATPKQRIVISAKERKEIIRRKGGCCKCGKKMDLQIHHLDKNPANNAHWNLQVLCYTCHKKTHSVLHNEVRHS